MSASDHSANRAPGFVLATNRIVSRLLGAGFPMGPNGVLTVRGRKSGVSRSTPVAVVEVAGKRWVQSPYGDVNWVRNLRAAGEGTITRGTRSERVAAVELTTEEKVRFFTEVLGPEIRSMRLGKLISSMLGLNDVFDDPEKAALVHPVFELRPAA
jgi:deazaflavin-dependent oxidoreductase (nitroreductase family)